jgi:signal transduction histidine kinase
VRTPLLTLVLLWLAAAGILFTGSRLARREIDERQPIDRAGVEEFWGAVQAELNRLWDLYERDLKEIAVAAATRDAPAIRALAQTVHGIRQVVIAPLEAAGSNTTVGIPSSRSDRVPDVVVRWKNMQGRAAETFVLELAQVAEEGLSGGWIEARTPAFGACWVRVNPSVVVVLVIDWRDVAEQTNGHLTRWIEPAYAPVRASGDLVSMEGPGGALLAGLTQPPARRPDFILPLRLRFGQWQVLAWDRSIRRTEFHQPTLVLTAAGSAVLALLGVAIFREQRRALRRAEERVSFVNRVSHELGTPLTNALLNLDLATEAIETEPNFARTRLLLVTEEVQRLARLVANVLTFSRQERGAAALKAAPCVPDEIVERVLRQFEPTLARRGIVVERHAHADAGVHLDPDALAQIAGNLISNVEKYAAAGGLLELTTRLESGGLSLQVGDRGPGIPAAERARIFQPFERVNSSVNEGASGTGLGLAIARDLAQRMGGTLALLPSAAGAVFELRVPAPPLIVSPSSREAA